MAWISVHEQVVGGKLRTLAKELNCSQNEALGMLVTLWLWGINNADSEGRIIGANVTVTGDIKVGSVSFKNHTHTDSTGGETQKPE